MQPLVTIITPTYNRPAMFAECATAVLAQTFTEWVWWVVFNMEQWNRDYFITIASKFKYDSRVLQIWYPSSEDEREYVHIPARIVNWLYPKVQTPYIYFLADDDLIDADGMKSLVEATLWHPEASISAKRLDAVYGRCEVQDQQADGTYKHACWCYDAGDVGLGTSIDPHCLLDGGQVLHTKALWDRATAEYDCPVCRGSGAMTSPSLQWIATCTHCGGSGQVCWKLSDTKDDAASNDGMLLSRLAQFARFYYVPQRIVTHRRHSNATHHKSQSEVR